MEWKKRTGIILIAIFTMMSFQVTEPARAEAGSLFGDLLGGILSTALGTDRNSMWDTYYDMVDNYYAAAYYSDKAAVVGGELLDKYGVAVRSEQVALVNSSSDSSDEMVQRTARMKITTIDTSLRDLDQFVAVTRRFDPDDDLVREFCQYKATQEEALGKANTAAGLLVAKRLLSRDYGRALGECIITALWYDSVKSRFANASGRSVNLLNQAIKQNYNVRVDKGKIKDAIKNVPRG